MQVRHRRHQIALLTRASAVAKPGNQVVMVRPSPWPVRGSRHDGAAEAGPGRRDQHVAAAA